MSKNQDWLLRITTSCSQYYRLVAFSENNLVIKMLSRKNNQIDKAPMTKIWHHRLIQMAKMQNSQVRRMKKIVELALVVQLIKIRRSKKRIRKNQRNWASSCLRFFWERGSFSLIDLRKSKSHSLSMELSTESNWPINKLRWFKWINAKNSRMH